MQISSSSSRIDLGLSGNKMRRKSINNRPMKLGIGELLLQLFLIAICVSIALFSGVVSALKVSINVPDLVKLNDAFWLNCSHGKTPSMAANQRPATDQASSTSGEIYAIKWYKDEEEFYRYLPNAEPKVSIYETNGIQLDQSKSFEGNVFLSKADVNSEGNYRCEILSEAPVFETVRKSKHLKVYALPVRGPRIEILDSNGKPKSPKAQEISYAVGDKIELRCNSAPSKPAARLRWYLNDQELILPQNATNNQNRLTSASDSSSSSNNRAGNAQRNSNFIVPILSSNNLAISQYDVRVTPIEYRQHYKGIFSSHSSLNLVLQQGDLINSKISFKCLASMRQEVPIVSKQLIVLTSAQQSMLLPSGIVHTATSGAVAKPTTGGNRFKRSQQSLISLLEPGALNNANDQIGNANDRSSTNNRHRLQYNTRKPNHTNQQNQKHHHQHHHQQPSSNRMLTSELLNGANEARFLASESEQRNQLAYIYEDADSTLGPSIISSPSTLEQHLMSVQGDTWHQSQDYTTNYTTGDDYNRSDNLDYLQFIRDRYARQRSLPGGSGANGAIGPMQGSTLSSTSSHNKRLFGPNSLVKSPMYLDEIDPLRPVINWPPLESGKLLLLPSDKTIVATLTPNNKHQQHANEVRFVLPPTPSNGRQLNLLGSNSFNRDDTSNQSQQQLILLEKLIENLNCTCNDGLIDTKMGWLINDLSVNNRDVHFYPARISSDHRQTTLLTIGLQSIATSPTASNTLQSILSSYYYKQKQPISEQSANYQKAAAALTLRHQQQQQDSSLAVTRGQNMLQNMPLTDTVNTHEQIRFACQATHSMLLYSSSEMITFDFNPPPIDDKFQSMSTNVIQATSAYQSSGSSTRTYSPIVLNVYRSQTILSVVMMILSSIFYMKLAIH